MNRRWISSFLLACTLVISAGVGCGGGDGGDADGSSTESPAAAEGIKNADCVAITNACHEVDEGDGEASECHELAHEDDAAGCKEARASCLAACK